MQIIPTKIHGVLDYLTAGVLLALPRLLNWQGSVGTLLTVMGVATILYSVLTRYELGLAKVIPMRGHLLLDALSGLTLLAAPFILRDPDPNAIPILMALGIFELGAALLTKHHPEDLSLSEG